MKHFVITSLLAVLAASTEPAWAGTWHRADSDHFIIYGDGRPSDLEDFAHELEKFDALLRMLWRLPENPNQRKLTIYTVGSSDEVERILGRPNIAGFYSPRLDGSFAVSNRIQTSRRDALSGKEVLFHEYAHHFMYRNFSVPAPSWFIEGFAEFVATAEFKKNGGWVFGKPAFHRATEVEYASRIPIRALLQFGSEGHEKRDMTAFYGWSWALTHMLYTAEEGRGAKVVDYLNRLNRGDDNLAAAEAAFGDLDALDRKLTAYVKSRIAYSPSDKPIAYDDDITVTPLSDGQGRVIELAMQRRGGGTFERALAELRALGGTDGASADALVELARAEYAKAHREEVEEEEGDDAVAKATASIVGDDPIDLSAALTAVDRALAVAPLHVEASVLKSRIMMETLSDQGDYDSPQWDEAEQYALRANQAEPSNPEALYSYAQLLLRQGKRDESVQDILRSAYAYAPEVRELRVAYAFELAANRRYDSAIALLQIIANDPHGGGSGRSAIERIEAMRDGQRELAETESLDDADEE